MRFSRAPHSRRTRRTMDIIMRLLLLSLCGLAASQPLGRLFQRRRDAYEVYAREYAREYEPYMFAAIPLHAPVPVLRVLSRAPLQPHAQPSAHHAAYARPAPHHYAEETRFYPHVQQYADPALQYAEPARQYAEPTRSYAKPARPYATAEQDYEASSYDYSSEYARPSRYRKPHRQAAPPAYEYAAEYASYAPHMQSTQPSPLPRLTYAIAPYDSVAYSATQEAAPTVLYARPSPSGGFTYRRVPNATVAPKKAPAPLKEKERDPPFIVKIHKYRIVEDDLI